MALATTLYSVADAHFLSGYQVSGENYGTLQEIWVGEDVHIERTVLKFSLSSISSPTVVITGATLKLYQYSDASVKTTVVKVHRTTSNWGETTVTWNNQPSYGKWLGQASIADGHRGDVSFTLNNDGKTTVQNWARGSWSNYGFFLFSELELDDLVGFRSREWGTQSQRPRLVLTYYDKPAISTSAASNIGSDRATLNGNITSVNGNNCTVRGFQYGLSETPTWTINESSSYGAGTYSLTPTGLYSDRKYYFRAYATNSAGTSYGSWLSFQMPGVFGGMI
jgi:hypothetical protein